jgi:hypothetical protein
MKHGMARGLVVALSLSWTFGCGSQEKSLVDRYFNAVRAKDHQTLTSFAAVAFDKPVESWKVLNVGEERRAPAMLPELLAKTKDVEAQLAANKKAAAAYNNEHYAQLEKVDALKKGAPVPGALAGVAAEWDKLKQKDKELKRALGAARDALEKEKRSMALSVGPLTDLESLTGQMVAKQLDLELVLKDEKPQPYVMMLRKYELVRQGGAKVMSRWVVYELSPKR